MVGMCAGVVRAPPRWAVWLWDAASGAPALVGEQSGGSRRRAAGRRCVGGSAVRGTGGAAHGRRCGDPGLRPTCTGMCCDMTCVETQTKSITAAAATWCLRARTAWRECSAPARTRRCAARLRKPRQHDAAATANMACSSRRRASKHVRCPSGGEGNECAATFASTPTPTTTTA